MTGAKENFNESVNFNRKVDTKDIHETLWRCRDFEISHLWQRSIFLTTFLVLCFTAYGLLIAEILDNWLEVDKIIPHVFVGYLLSLVGIIFSVMWIKMTKGSKAWYEKYESAISQFENNEQYMTTKAKEIGGFNIIQKSHENNQLNSSIRSTKGGAYSVSKINIGIGQVFLILWVIISLTHTFVGYYFLDRTYPDKFYLGIIPDVMIIILAIVLIFVSSTSSFKSSHI